MRAVIIRVSRASINIDGDAGGSMDKGFVVLVGVKPEDTTAEAAYLAKKCAELRVFEDENGKMNKALADVGGSMMVVSNFTLYADCSHGRRPDFFGAAKLLKDHMLVFINESSTTQFLIEYMQDFKDLTVITNSLPACNLLNRYNINFYCTGGQITHANCFTGYQTEQFIRRYNADMCFFSSHAISQDGNITENSEAEHYITSAMIE